MKKTFKVIVSALLLSAILVGGTVPSAEATTCGPIPSKPCLANP